MRLTLSQATLISACCACFAASPSIAEVQELATGQDTAVAQQNPPTLSPSTPEELLAQLAEVDRSIEGATGRIEQLESDITAQDAELDTLQAQINRRRTLSDDQQSKVLAQIRATWRLHTLQQRRARQYAKPPSQWRRTQRYLDALQTHLEKQRGRARLALVDVMETVHAADTVQRTLHENRRDLERERNNLNHLWARRKPVLIELDAATARSGDSLITVYAETDDVRQAFNTGGKALAQNGLPWPLVGTIKTHFGEKIPETKRGSLGIQIDALAGETAHAISRGVVVFADWLRGQGLLAVIDHGDGMMAVYGNNQRLLVQVGDTVDVGDPIAYIGADATERQAQLYFELRLEGQAVNPLSWLTPTPG